MLMCIRYHNVGKNVKKSAEILKKIKEMLILAFERKSGTTFYGFGTTAILKGTFLLLAKSQQSQRCIDINKKYKEIQ